MPSFLNGGGAPAAMPTARHPGRQEFVPRPLATAHFTVSGVTRDSLGNALGSCTVKLYKTLSDELIATTTSDASGNWSFALPTNSDRMYAVAYKPGSPDVAGATVNTLTPTVT